MFAGLDVGSTNVKFSIYDGDGTLCAEACERYLHENTRLTSAAVWQAVLNVTAEAVAGLSAGCQVEALAISAFGESLIPVDENGTVLSDRFVCNLADGDEQLEQILGQIPPDKLREITGVFPHRRFPLVKLLWFRENTMILKRAVRYFTMEDYLISRFTGENAISESSAARTMLYDCKNHCWSRQLLNLVGIEASSLSEIHPSGTYIGTVRGDVGKTIGFGSHVKVFTGGHDQMCNAVGAGLFEQGTAVNCSGTVECISALAGKKRAGERKDRIPVQIAPYPGQTEGQFIFLAPVAGCSSLDWCLQLVSGKQNPRAKDLVQEHMDMQAQCGRMPSSLYTMPYFTGRNYPDYNSHIEAGIFGINLRTTKQELYQSVMEGIVFELMLCLKYLGHIADGFEQIAVVGGGAQSEYFMQLKADMFQLPVLSMQHKEAGTMGAMLLAAAGAGYYRDLREAARSCIKIKRTFYSDEKIHDQYVKKFERYQKYRELYFMR